MRNGHPFSGIASRSIVSGKFRIALACLVVILHFAILYSVVFQTPSVIWPFHYDTIYGMGRGEDFYAVYHAGVNTSRDTLPYRNNDDGVTPYFQAFRYLPIVAIAAQGLILLPPLQAYLGRVLFLEVWLFTLIFILHKHTADQGVWLAASTILLINSPYFLEVHMGQFTFVTTALCVMSLYLSLGLLPIPLRWY